MWRWYGGGALRRGCDLCSPTRQRGIPRCQQTSISWLFTPIPSLTHRATVANASDHRKNHVLCAVDRCSSSAGPGKTSSSRTGINRFRLLTARSTSLAEKRSGANRRHRREGDFRRFGTGRSSQSRRAWSKHSTAVGMRTATGYFRIPAELGMFARRRPHRIA